MLVGWLTGGVAGQRLGVSDVRGQDSGRRHEIQCRETGQHRVEPSDQGHRLEGPRTVQMYGQHVSNQDKTRHATRERYCHTIIILRNCHTGSSDPEKT